MNLDPLRDGKILTIIAMYQKTHATILYEFLKQYAEENPGLAFKRGRRKILFSELVCRLLNFRMPRRIWMKPRLKLFWEHFKRFADEDQWIESFRMKQTTFKYVVNQVKKVLEPGFNPLQPSRAVSSDEQVAIFVYTLASCAEYRVIGQVFGYHKSTICKIVRKVCDAILNHLMPVFVKMPDAADCEKISAEFEHICGIPQIILVIDGSHIPVRPSELGKSDFFNRKGWPSIVLQAVVDYAFR